MIVFAVVEEALSPDFPLGVELEAAIGRTKNRAGWAWGAALASVGRTLVTC